MSQMVDVADDHDALLRAVVQLFGGLIHVTGYDNATVLERRAIDFHLRDIISIPVSVTQRTVDAGLGGIFIGAGSIIGLDDMGFLRSAQPIGWRPDTTYEHVPGVYDRRRKFVVVGTRGQTSDAQHTLLHEFGHAVGDLLGLNEAAIIADHHREVHFWTRLPPYFRGNYPGDPRGQREIVAELFRDRILSEGNLHQRWGRDLIAWLEQELDLS